MWYTKFGPSGDIVLSSRIRLARNIEKIPFGSKLTQEGLDKVKESCISALPDLKYIDLSSMSQAERNALKECHIISNDMAKNQSGGILVNESCSLSIMLGEEDHIRIQAMSPGFDLKNCMDKANTVDDLLEEKVDFAFLPQLGYLTCCPTNAGTGLRASVMVHLPALTLLGNIESVVRSISKFGLTVRGIYGEGSKALGNIYQISNQVTLGVTEEESIDKLTQIITELISKERSASQELYEKRKLAVEDMIFRAKGILQNSRIITSGEAMQLISDVRWGINLGIIKDIDHEQLLKALYDSLPANIEKAYNTTTPAERDARRSEVLRSHLDTNKS